MAGIFDTLAQVRMETPDAATDWAKQVEAANARAAAIKAARGVAAGVTPAAPTVAPGMLGRLAAQFPWARGVMGSAPGMLGRAGAAVPGWASAPGILGGAGAVTAAVPEVLGPGGVLDVANDPAASKIDVASRFGRGMTRVGLTAAGAGLGAAAGGGLASLITAPIGGYLGNKLADFILPENADTPAVPATIAPTPVAPVAPVVAPDTSPIIGPADGSDKMSARNLARVNEPGFGVAPMTVADIQGNAVPRPGTGAAMNTRTGRVINLSGLSGPDAADEAANALHARDVAVYGTGGGPDPVPTVIAGQHSWAGNAVGAKMNINRRANDARQAAGYAKLGADIALRRDTTAAAREGHYLTASTAREKTAAELVGKGATAAHATAQANEINARVVDAERVRAAGGTQEEINAARSGRPMTGGGVVVTPGMKEGQVITTERRTGASTTRQAMPPLREIDIAASLNAAPKGTTREQVIQMFKDRGYIVKDFEKFGSYGVMRNRPGVIVN